MQLCIPESIKDGTGRTIYDHFYSIRPQPCNFHFNPRGKNLQARFQQNLHDVLQLRKLLADIREN